VSNTHGSLKEEVPRRAQSTKVGDDITATCQREMLKSTAMPRRAKRASSVRVLEDIKRVTHGGSTNMRGRSSPNTTVEKHSLTMAVKVKPEGVRGKV
jgi:hypothetical protein